MNYAWKLTHPEMVEGHGGPFSLSRDSREALVVHPPQDGNRPLTVQPDGTVDAKSFTGDGSALTVNGSLSIKDALDKKVNNSGGNITGSLTISGNVGIGTASPGAKLEVADGDTDPLKYGSLQITRSANNNGNKELFLSMIRKGARVAGLGFVPNSNKWGLFNQNTDTPVLTVDDTNVGIGTIDPKATLDIADGTRTRTHASSPKGLYVTGEFGPADGVEFRHNNGCSGIGIGFNTIYAAGSNANDDVNIRPKGTGKVGIETNTLSLGGVEITADQLRTMLRLISGEAKIALRSRCGHLLDNYSCRVNSGDHNRSAQFQNYTDNWHNITGMAFNLLIH